MNKRGAPPSPNAGALEDQTSPRPWRAKTSGITQHTLDILDQNGEIVAIVGSIEDTALIIRSVNGGDNA